MSVVRKYFRETHSECQICFQRVRRSVSDPQALKGTNLDCQRVKVNVTVQRQF
jgi:hypothetical protein